MKFVIHADSTVKNTYSGYMVLHSFKDLLSFKSVNTKITLVVHSFSDSWFEGLLDLQEFVKRYGSRVKRLLYVNKEPINECVSYVLSIGGKVEVDESVLQDVNTLNEFLMFMDEVDELEGIPLGLTVTTEGRQGVASNELALALSNENLPALASEIARADKDLSALSLLVDRLEIADKEVFTPVMVETLRNVVEALSQDKARLESEKEMYMRSVSRVVESTSEFKKQSSEVLAQMQENTARFAGSMGDYFNRGSGVTYMPFTLSRDIRSRVVVFKDYKSTPYITTFLRLFRQYLSTRSKGALRTKLVILENNSALLDKRYKGVYKVTEGTSNSQKTLTSDEVLVTRVLKDEVMNLFANSPELVIFLDRTSSVQPMISGMNVKFVPIVMSQGDIERFGLNPNGEILSLVKSVSKVNKGLALPILNLDGVSSDRAMKESQIFKQYERLGIFSKLAQLLTIDKEG